MAIGYYRCGVCVKGVRHIADASSGMHVAESSHGFGDCHPYHGIVALHRPLEMV